MSNIVKLKTYRYEIDWSYEYEVEINVDEYVYFTVDWRGERSWHLIGHKVDENHNWSEKELSYDWCFLRDIADFIAKVNNIKDKFGNTRCRVSDFRNLHYSEGFYKELGQLLKIVEQIQEEFENE